MKKINDPFALAREAGAQIKDLYGSELVSVILYGSAAGGDFHPRKSDINLLIVLKQLSFEAVCSFNPLWKKLEKKHFALPIFMDPSYLQRALDSFPIEFLNMKGCHSVIEGDDVLEKIVIDREHIRLQAERELRGKLLHLFSDGVESGNKGRRLASLIELSLKDFGAVFRALLFMKDQTIEKDRKNIFSTMENVFALEGKPLTKAYEAVEAGDKHEIRAAFPGYAKAIQCIIEKIDLTRRE